MTLIMNFNEETAEYLASIYFTCYKNFFDFIVHPTDVAVSLFFRLVINYSDILFDCDIILQCFITLFFVHLFFVFMYKKLILSDCLFKGGVKRALIIIAHPDDEAMFFGPTIVKLINSSKVYMRCFTIGDYYGNGKKRINELNASCKSLGISTSNLIVFKHDKLPDDPNEEWDEKLVAKKILYEIETLRADTVISFDKYGVSGHANHISIYKALKLLKDERKFPNYCNCYVLDSVSLIRKYFGVFNLLYDYITCSNICVSLPEERKNIRDAMAKHKSQYVFYRKLFMIFSRYTYINSFTCTTR